jgi:hypothetical protein
VNRFFSLFAIIFIVPVLIIPVADTACAQQASGLFGAGWFDWSDFRAESGMRFLVGRFKSGTVNRSGTEWDLTGRRYGFDKEPVPFGEFWAEVYVDRLGIRVNWEPHTFSGINPSSDVFLQVQQQISQLKMPDVRLGLDLNIIRNPFVRAGINYDYYWSSATFYDRSPGFPDFFIRLPPLMAAELSPPPAALLITETFSGARPMTVGLQARILPFRIFDIPTTMQGRVRIPVPFLNRNFETKITDWDFSIGLRPAIWDTSLYGHATFSVDFEIGYRSISLDMNGHLEERSDSSGGAVPITTSPSSMDLRGHWEGLYVQAGVFF